VSWRRCLNRRLGLGHPLTYACILTDTFQVLFLVLRTAKSSSVEPTEIIGLEVIKPQTDFCRRGLDYCNRAPKDASMADQLTIDKPALHGAVVGHGQMGFVRSLHELRSLLPERARGPRSQPHSQVLTSAIS